LERKHLKQLRKYVTDIILNIFKVKKSAHPKIKQQLILIFLSGCIIPILIIGLFSLHNVRKQMNNNYTEQLKAEATRLNSTLFDITTSLFTTCEPFILNDMYNSVLSCTNFDDTQTAYYDSLTSSLKTIRDNYASISSIHVYTNNPNIPGNAYITYSDNDFKNQQWYNALSKNTWNNYSITTSENSLHQKSFELTLTRKIAVTASHYSAYIVVTISNVYLKNRLIYTDNFILASLDNTPVFFSSDSDWMNKHMPMPDNFKGGYYQYTGPVSIDSTQYYSTIAMFLPYKTQNKFYILVSKFDAYDQIYDVTVQYIIILLTAILIPAIFILIYSSFFSSRIITLRKVMHQVRLGNSNIIENFRGDDELSETFEDLKATMDLIQMKEAKFYKSLITEQQLINKQQQMEFKMLASQINPHFLYNTLETIRMQALSNGNRNVATSIKLLGKSMHYVLENTGTESTTLAKEIDHVKVYLAIQQLRFGDRVNYSLNIQDGLNIDQYKILPLLLQPIVENAVIHGLEGIEKNGNIDITISHIQNDNLIIKINDNGNGMDQNELNHLDSRINFNKPEHTHSIGLYNINQRIKLFYGAKYKLQVTSKIHCGTTVILTLPMQNILDE